MHSDVLSWEANLPFFVAMLSSPDVVVRGIESIDRKVAALVLHIICRTGSLASERQGALQKSQVGVTMPFCLRPPQTKQKKGGGT